jgi:hypothetical protein
MKSETKFTIDVHITGCRHGVLLSMITFCALYPTSRKYLRNMYIVELPVGFVVNKNSLTTS